VRSRGAKSIGTFRALTRAHVRRTLLFDLIVAMAASALENIAEYNPRSKHPGFMLTIWKGPEYRARLIERLEQLTQQGKHQQLYAASYQQELAPSTGQHHFQVRIPKSTIHLIVRIPQVQTR
jgi:hypothetical protein